MLYSVTEAMGTGDPIEVPVPPYISKDHITVYVDFLPTLAFEWIAPQRIRLLVPQNKMVRVVRSTSPAERLTVYHDGTLLGGDTLNVDSLQAFFLAQEARDIALLSGSVVGTPAPGVESTTSGLLSLLLGNITEDQLTPTLANLVKLIDAGSTIPGSVAWRVAQEAAARADSIQAEQAARVAALLAEATSRSAAITQERTERQDAVSSLTTQISTLTASVAGAVGAVQTEVTARADADSALGQRIDTVVANLGDATAAITDEAQARVDGDTALADRVGTVETTMGTLGGRVTTLEQAGSSGDVSYANYTIKTEARADGKLAVAGIKLTSTAATSAPTQSDIIFMADKFYFVPSMVGINTTPQTLFTTGLVNGGSTTIFNSILWGDKTVPARVLVDGFLEARHITAEAITVDKIDTRGMTIKDAAGNVVLAAGTSIDYTKFGGASANLSALGYMGALDATRNLVTYSSTAPTSPFNGDIWVDTSVTPNVTRVRVAGAWQVSANLTTNTNQLTDGANLGQTAVWSSVTGTGKPADNATVGAPAGTQVGGRDVTTLLTDVDTAKSSAATAISNLSAKLDKAGGTISGRVTMSVADGIFAGSDLNNGVYMGNSGLVAKQGGAVKFALGTDGAATFAGILSAATGTFAGSLSAATGTFAGALSGASGTFSGTLTASAVDAVNTVNIAGDALVVPRRGAFSRVYGGTSSADFLAYTLPAIDFLAGGRVVIFIRWASYAPYGNSAIGGFYIKCNGTKIWDTGRLASYGGSGGDAPESATGQYNVPMFTIEHNPPAGLCVYTVHAYCQAYSNSNAEIETTLITIKR